MKRIIFAASFILLLASCKNIKIPKDETRKGYFVSFDTIKVADSTFVVNVIYQQHYSQSISAVKICTIKK